MQTLAISYRLSPTSNRLCPIPVTAICTRSSGSVACVRSLKCSSISTSSFVNDEMKFAEAAKNANLVPLHRCIFSDHLTPVLAYRCLVKEDDREAPSFLY